MKNEKMRYADRYTTLTVRFKPGEWEDFMDMYDAVREETGVEVSKHMFLKTLIREGMLYSGAIGVQVAQV